MSDRDPFQPDSGREMANAIGLLIVAVLLLVSFMLYQAITDRNVLLATIANQDQPLQQAQQIKSRLAALTSDTAKLADAGDAGAKEIIAAMKKQGIKIEP
jgi:hypothetical protein